MHLSQRINLKITKQRHGQLFTLPSNLYKDTYSLQEVLLFPHQYQQVSGQTGLKKIRC